MKFYVRVFFFFRKYVEKIQVLPKSDKNNGRFAWKPTYVYQSFLPRMRNVSKKKAVEKIKTHILYCIIYFFFFENRAVYEIMWKKYCAAGQATDANIIQRMRIASEVPRATNTHSEYVILIAFPPQQRLGERFSVLRCTLLFFQSGAMDSPSSNSLDT